jgi:hypothetical protein
VTSLQEYCAFSLSKSKFCFVDLYCCHIQLKNWFLDYLESEEYSDLVTIFAPSEILLTNAVINAARLGISAYIFLGCLSRAFLGMIDCMEWVHNFVNQPIVLQSSKFV